MQTSPIELLDNSLLKHGEDVNNRLAKPSSSQLHDCFAVEHPKLCGLYSSAV